MVHVAFCADQRFEPGLYAAVASLLRHTTADVQVHLLDAGMTPVARDRLTSFVTQRCACHWYPAPMDAFRRYYVNRTLGHAAFVRITLPDILPAEVAKVIYLDSDVVACADVAELWAIDMRGWAVAGVPDAAIPFFDPAAALGPGVSVPPGIRNEAPVPGWRQRGIAGTERYYNSGVLVMDLGQWRRDGIAAELRSFLEQHHRQCVFADQEAINAVLAGRWQTLPWRWNQQTAVWSASFAALGLLDESALAALRDRPAIIHYTGSKPWEMGCRHPLAAAFFAALVDTPLAGWRPHRWSVWGRSLWRTVCHVPRAMRRHLRR